MALAQRGHMFAARPAVVAGIGLHDILGAPVADDLALVVRPRYGLRRVAADADQPSAHLARLHVVELRMRAGAEWRRLVSVAQENHVRRTARFLRRADRPEYALPNLARFAPAHAAVDPVERCEQVAVVGADLDRCEQEQGAVFGEGAPPDSGTARQIAQRASRGLARIREAAGGRFAELVVGDVHALRDV